jgi:hypothetical protein
MPRLRPLEETPPLAQNAHLATASFPATRFTSAQVRHILDGADDSVAIAETASTAKKYDASLTEAKYPAQSQADTCRYEDEGTALSQEESTSVSPDGFDRVRT